MVNKEPIIIFESDKKQCPNKRCNSEKVKVEATSTVGKGLDSSMEKPKYTIYKCLDCETWFKVKEL